MGMALKGVRVLEIAGLAPAPYCGMVLADFGASVVRIDKTTHTLDVDRLSNGKKSVAINFKHPKGIEIFKRLCLSSDVIIEPFRKGVMESLGLGPDVLTKVNPKLIYARLSGFGQNGVYSVRAGHDINYVAMSGVLSMVRGEGNRPSPPCNALSDFGGGGLMCALGIVLALLERQRSQRGQVVDCSMVEGTAYLASWLMRSQTLPIWGNPPGGNLLDGGAHFYMTYETKDGKWMAVGALEPQFYDELLKGLGLDVEKVPQFPDDSTECRRIFSERFKQKTQEEWCQIFEKMDACVTPVLTLEEAPRHPHNVVNQTFAPGGEVTIPRPAPRLSRTPGLTQALEPAPEPGQHTREVLTQAGLSPREVDELLRLGAVACHDSKL